MLNRGLIIALHPFLSNSRILKKPAYAEIIEWRGDGVLLIYDEEAFKRAVEEEGISDGTYNSITRQLRVSSTTLCSAISSTNVLLKRTFPASSRSMASTVSLEKKVEPYPKKLSRPGPIRLW